MEIFVRVEVSGPGGGLALADVMVSVEPAHSVAELVDALSAGLGYDVDPGWTLTRTDRGEILDRSMLLVEVGLVSGEHVLLGAPSPAGTSDAASAGRAGEAERALQIVVCSGPDVGRTQRLEPGLGLIGRDGSCWFVLADPQVGRAHVRLQWDGAQGLSIVGRDPDFPVMVDGEPVTAETEISVGQLIRLGASTLAVRWTESSPSGHRSHLGDIPFHRTPYYPAPVEPVLFEPLGDVPEKPEPTPFAYLAALMPLILGVALALLYSPRFLIFAAFSPIVAIAGYFDQRRRVRRRFGQGEERFRQRLVERGAEVRRALVEERARRFFGGPDLATLAERARTRSVELWVRDRGATDVLRIRVGLGATTPLVTVRSESRGDETLRDEIDAEMEAITAMNDVPVAIDLMSAGVLGLVGDDRDTTALATSLVIQACCLHSPEDLIVAALVAEKRAMANWLKWLPHVRSPSSPIAGAHLAGDRTRADQLLKELLVVAEQRLAANDRGSSGYWPRLLVIIDRRLEPEPSLVSRLFDLGPTVGIAVVWLTAGKDRVPRQAEAVVTCRSLLDQRSSVVSYTDPDLDDEPLQIERLDSRGADTITRSLAPLRDASSATSSSALPRLVTLHHALDTEDVDADWVRSQWSIDRGDSLPGPMGMAANGPLMLDLVHHGPHGLIGGTSGAGKSELLMSMVAGLMALNPPNRANFLFIDYKGGASSEVFRDAPHTVGCVTNLDALLARRALTSLRAELNRRMDLLHGRAKDVGELLAISPEEAPPSLVIVVDEFATLVKEVPEFMVGIVDIAQRGRSLGIHLILATQRPSGAVNENILANTNLRISLRMLDGAESLSVIGTPDAAAIPTPLKGRGFARLGPGELVPFQTAWSGAPLLAAEGPPPVQVVPFTSATVGPTAASPTSAQTSTAGTQIDELLASIREAASVLRLPESRSPWLDELPEQLSLRSVRRSRLDRLSDGASGFVVPITLVDDPDAQDQYGGLIDFEADGGLLVFGAGGSGKTTALRTLAVSAAIDDDHQGGGTLTIFGLDFASRQLTVLSSLPQCAAIATGDDLEAVTRIVTLLVSELDRRLAVAAEAGRRGADAPDFDRVLLLIDDYGSLAQSFEGAGVSAALYVWLERINRLIVDGRQVGIHTAATASRRAAVRSGVLSAMANRIVLRQSDAAAYVELDVSAPMIGDLDLPPGRGFINASKLCQVAVVTADPPLSAGSQPSDDTRSSGDGTSTASAQQQAVRAVASILQGSVADGLATEPLPVQVPPTRPTGRSLSAVLGIADLTLEPIELDLSVSDLAVLGDPRSGRSTALATLACHLVANGSDVWLAGVAGSPLTGLASSVAQSAFGRGVALLPFLQELLSGLEADPSLLLVIDDVDLLEDPALDSIFGLLLQAGLRFAASTGSLRGYSTSPLIQAMKKARSVLMLRPSDAHEIQEATGVAVSLRPGPAMAPGRAVLVANRYPTVIQVSNFFGE